MKMNVSIIISGEDEGYIRDVAYSGFLDDYNVCISNYSENSFLIRVTGNRDCLVSNMPLAKQVRLTDLIKSVGEINSLRRF